MEPWSFFSWASFSWISWPHVAAIDHQIASCAEVAFMTRAPMVYSVSPA